MSNKVKERLARMMLLHLTTSEERHELDKVIEEKTGLYCDLGVDRLSDETLKKLLEEARLRLKKKKISKEAQLAVV